MIFRFLSILMLLNTGGVVGQTQKPDLYLLFKADSAKKMYKIPFDSGDTRLVAYDFVVPLADGRKAHYAYTPLNMQDFIWVDSNFVKRHAKTFGQVKANPNLGYDSQDQKRYPYKRVFILEFWRPNRFKLIEVTSYIGSEHLLPN